MKIIYLYICFLVGFSCTTHRESPQPPDFLTALYDADFTYAEYDSLQLRALPIFTPELIPLFTEQELEPLGLSLPHTLYTLESGVRWIIPVARSGLQILERSSTGFTSRELGKTGQGPGEYLPGEVNRVLVRNDGIYFSAGRGSRLLHFDLQGNFLQQFPVKLSWIQHIYPPSDTAQHYVMSHATGSQTLATIRTSEQFELDESDVTPCLPLLPAQDGWNEPYEVAHMNVDDAMNGAAIHARFPYVIFFRSIPKLAVQ